MISISNYINDGANWQAQSVLAYLRYIESDILSKTYNSEYHHYDAELKVGRYENCREQGYVFTISYMGNQKHYAVYQHRNSDSLIVLIANGFSMNTPSIDFMWKEHTDENGNNNKYDYDKDFSCGSIVECGDYIAEDMQKFITEIINKK